MRLRDTPRVLVAIGRVMADSERTDEIHLVEELTGQHRFIEFLEQTSSDPAVAALLADQPELCSEQVDFDALRALPADTLGRRYIGHLDDNGLSADSQATPTTAVDDEDISYLVRRFRQTHDVWHALVGLGVEGHEEVLIHAFSWGQLRLPVSALVIGFGSLKHIVLEGRWGALTHDLGEAFRVGRDSAPLLGVRWEDQWNDPIDDVRARYRLRPLSAP